MNVVLSNISETREIPSHLCDTGGSRDRDSEKIPKDGKLRQLGSHSKQNWHPHYCLYSVE